MIWPLTVFLKKEFFPDEEFFNKNCAMALKFHSEIIMPEFLGRYFTRESAKLIRWGICKGVGHGTLIIKCEGDECRIK